MAVHVLLSFVDYLGGLPRHPGPYKGGAIALDEFALDFSQFKNKIRIPTANIVAVNIEGPEQAEKRITATRMLALGIFSVVAKKNTTEAFLSVETRKGNAAMFMKQKMSAGQLRTKLAPWLAGLPNLGASAVPQVEDEVPGGDSTDAITEKLTALAGLHAAGVLTDEEFATKKAELLGRL